MIEPRYVSIEQAKWLKSIGFNEDVKSFYIDNVIRTEDLPGDWNDGRFVTSIKNHGLVVPVNTPYFDGKECIEPYSAPE
jgi:hypothetical protein